MRPGATSTAATTATLTSATDAAAVYKSTSIFKPATTLDKYNTVEEAVW